MCEHCQIYIKRICSKSGIEYPLTCEFFRFDKQKNKFRTNSKESERQYDMSQENITKRKIKYADNKEELCQKQRERNAQNKEARKEYDKKRTPLRREWQREYDKKRRPPKSGPSAPEKQIAEFLTEQNIKYETEKTFPDCRGLKDGLLNFDFYLPDHNTIIEYDGIHHSKPIYGQEKLKYTKFNDQIKNDFCKENRINLIRINYQENLIEKLSNVNRWDD